MAVWSKNSSLSSEHKDHECCDLTVLPVFGTHRPEGLQSCNKKASALGRKGAGSLLTRRRPLSNTQFVVTTPCAASIIGRFPGFLNARLEGKAKKWPHSRGRVQPKTLSVRKRYGIIKVSSPDVYSTYVYRRRAWAKKAPPKRVYLP